MHKYNEALGLIIRVIAFLIVGLCVMAFLDVHIADASTPADDAADRAYCREYVANQMATQRTIDSQNELARATVNALASILLGSDAGRTAITTTRTATYGQLSRSRTDAAQRRMLERQCINERKHDR